MKTYCPKSTTNLLRQNVRAVKQLHPTLASQDIIHLRELTNRLRLSIANGELLLVNGKWYVTHSGLLQVAQRNRCSGIRTEVDRLVSDPESRRWVFKATVYRAGRSKGFVGYGDADPSNVSALVRGAEMRMAETRAVNRALRKAYGIGICSVEELGSFSGPLKSAEQLKKPVAKVEPANGNHHPLRDRLCLLIRQHQLEPSLVKAYAAGYCGVPELRQASREQVEAFVKHLAEYASNDRDGLICQLNSHAQPKENPEEKAAGAA